MPLFHTEEQIMLADVSRTFFAGEAPRAQLRALRDAGDRTGFSPGLWKAFADLGFTGVRVGEIYGGCGLGHVEAGILAEEIGRALTPSPFLTTSVGLAEALELAPKAIRGRWLPAMTRGELVGALALDEGPKHRPQHIAMRAEAIEGGYLLFGEKRFVAHGHLADLVVVAARTSGEPDDPAGVTLFLVEGGSPNLHAEVSALVDASVSARMRFDGVRVGEDAVLGQVAAGASALAVLLAALRAGAAAELVGVADGALAMTLDYLKQRRQFGRPIGSFQALQHRTAHLYAELEVARAAVLKAQQLLDAGAPQGPAFAMVAKGVAGAASLLVVQEAVQMHGGMGMTDECDIGLYMKRQRVLAEMFGDTDYHAEQLARLSGY